MASTEGKTNHSLWALTLGRRIVPIIIIVASFSSSIHLLILRGYSFTTVAFAHSLAPNEVKLVDTWPNRSTGHTSAQKVPTEIRYTNVRTRTYQWGYEVIDANSADTLRWFKLFLQPHPKSNLLQPWEKFFEDAPRKKSVKPLHSLVNGPSVIGNKSN